MRYKFLILIAIFLSVSLNAQKGGKKKKEKKKDERETPAEIGDSLLDIIDEEFETLIEYYDDGTKLKEGKYLRLGEWKYYHPNGDLDK